MARDGRPARARVQRMLTPLVLLLLLLLPLCA